MEVFCRIVKELGCEPRHTGINFSSPPGTVPKIWLRRVAGSRRSSVTLLRAGWIFQSPSVGRRTDALHAA